ncbi:MAG: hypothetical protein [Bacteriophage sp.]|nr:MAG: hypothetical protein [Bacteriophage sp.]
MKNSAPYYIEREDLERELVDLGEYTREPYVYGYYVHIKTNGEMLVIGTLRECYDYVKAFIYGIRYAKWHNIH